MDINRCKVNTILAHYKKKIAFYRRLYFKKRKKYFCLEKECVSICVQIKIALLPKDRKSHFMPLMVLMGCL
jgi:hypothetical protein